MTQTELEKLIVHRVQTLEVLKPEVKRVIGDAKRIRRGPVQNEIMARLGLPVRGITRRRITEAARALGYKTVYLHGIGMYKWIG